VYNIPPSTGFMIEFAPWLGAGDNNKRNRNIMEALVRRRSLYINSSSLCLELQ
jgi:hypothetical protein